VERRELARAGSKKREKESGSRLGGEAVDLGGGEEAAREGERRRRRHGEEERDEGEGGDIFTGEREGCPILLAAVHPNHMRCSFPCATVNREAHCL
jgi:hypothetical protein